MKEYQKLIIAFVFSLTFSNISIGQIGIGTTSPKAILDVKQSSTVYKSGGGVLIPRYENVPSGTGTEAGNEHGEFIFVTSENSFYFWDGTNWNPFVNTGISPNCNNSGIEGAVINGISNSITFSVTLSNLGTEKITLNFSNSDLDLNTGSNVTFSNEIINVDRTTIELAAGESEKVTYSITFTPTVDGNLGTQDIFAVNWSITSVQAGITYSCSDQVEVLFDASSLSSANLTNTSKLLYATAIGNSHTIRQNVNNSDAQITIEIPYSGATVGLEYLGYNSGEITVNPGTSFDNADVISLVIPSGTFSSSSGTLTATLIVKAVNNNTNTLVLKSIQANTSQSTVSQHQLVEFNGVTIGSGTSATISIDVTSLIYHKRYSNSQVQRFVYYPVTAADGSMWLGTNLGSEYNNVNSPNFNPLAQATSVTDHLAYGSLYQWGRDADGHQLTSYLSSTSATASISGLVLGPIDYDPTVQTQSKPVLFTNAVNIDWRNPSNGMSYQALDNDLWDAQNDNTNGTSGNDPCPSGYHIPTYSEFFNGMFNVSLEGSDGNTSGDATIPTVASGGNPPLGTSETGSENFYINSANGMTYSTYAPSGNNASVGAFTANNNLYLPYGPTRNGEAGIYTNLGSSISQYWVSDRFRFANYRSFNNTVGFVEPDDNQAIIVRLRNQLAPLAATKSSGHPIRCIKD